VNARSCDGDSAWDTRFFYEFQEQLSGAYSGPVTGYHRAKAGLISRHCAGVRRVLELGAGGGQMAVATAELGYAVDAIELVPRLATHARELAAVAHAADINVIEGDFFVIQLEASYDAVTYWDGFGIGRDADQEALLGRIRHWLTDDGKALIDVYTPQYWSKMAGREMSFGRAHRRYDFDPATQTMVDTWWTDGAEHEATSQHLRCYRPDELRRLLADAALWLEAIVPAGAYDPDTVSYREEAALEDAIAYTAVIKR
jgi:SAM-dependent methyltransferase